MSTLYVRGKKSVWIGFTDKDGIRRDRATGYKLDPVIRRGSRIVWPHYILEFQRELDQAVILDKWGFKFKLPKSMKLQEAFDKFIEFKKPKRSPATIRMHELSFRKLKEKVGDARLQAITEERMVAVRDSMIAQDGTYNAAAWLRHLAAFFSFCVERKYIEASPVTKNIKLAQPEAEILIWAEKDLEMVLQYIGEHDGKPAEDQLRFQLLTGWRIGDNVRLRTENIDYNRRVIQHYLGKTRKRFEYPMDVKLYRHLKALPTYGEYQFKYRSESTIGHIFKEALREKNIPNAERMSLHDLRKQFAFNCHRNGVPVEVCARLMGITMQTALRYYTYWDTGILRKALTSSRKRA